LAGDDTIFILMRDEAGAQEFVEQLNRLLEQKR
jgi:arginine repressor